jgi:phosphate transport system substrate-binding protein
MRKINLCLISILSFLACKEETKIGPNAGSAFVVADEASKEMIDALTENYHLHYPESNLKPKYVMEDIAVADFLNGKTDMVCLSRPLTSTEKAILKSNLGVDWKPANVAADAVIFVVDKNDPRQFIDLKDIEQGLKTESTKLIADAGNGSNINTLCRYFKIPLKEAKFRVIKGNVAVAQQIKNKTSQVGVTSLNSISRPHSAFFKSLRSDIKILPVKKHEQLLEASLPNLQQNKYPFIKIMYFLTKEHYFGLCNGFIKFSCTQLGQIIVSKQGIQPYYRYQRQIILE